MHKSKVSNHVTISLSKDEMLYLSRVSHCVDGLGLKRSPSSVASAIVRQWLTDKRKEEELTKKQVLMSATFIDFVRD